MVDLGSKIAIVGLGLIAVLYQFVIRGLIFDFMGVGRQLSLLSTFNVSCEKVTELGLEGCEDMWLHEPTGYLYMACSDSQSRTQWLPAFVLVFFFFSS
jgi:arylesterase/paraoxonase